MENTPSMSICIAAAAALIVTCVVTGLLSLALLLRRISSAVGLAGPTTAMLKEEEPAKNALFRHLPKLATKFAWRSLGVKKATPIHVCRIPSKEDDGKELSFLLKREDLILDDYGGNKVRTLQHQLAVCEARREGGEKAFQQLVSLGSGGSNQVIATVVHARKLGWDGKEGDINCCWFDSDEPDLDNTLNMLSVLSFPNVGFTHDWGKFGMGKTLGAIREAWTQTNMVPMPMGGNCPSGVLGQVGGILELAEQIVAGESPDPTRIYVPIGSGCTVSGLILGTVLVRHLGIKALSGPHFEIVGCNVHDGFAAGDRALRLHINPLFKFMPLTITHSVLSACQALVEMGGPDLTKEAMEFIQSSVSLRSDKDVVGKYGGHSDLTRETAKCYDEKGSVTNLKTGSKEKNLWMCGHFVAKAVHPLLQDLEATCGDSESKEQYMLWMTKSAVQPRGDVDEWSKFVRSNDAVKKWANKGKAESVLRPGRVDTNDGKPEDYRSLMTSVLE